MVSKNFLDLLLWNGALDLQDKSFSRYYSNNLLEGKVHWALLYKMFQFKKMFLCWKVLKKVSKQWFKLSKAFLTGKRLDCGKREKYSDKKLHQSDWNL